MRDITLHIPDNIDLDEKQATQMLAGSLYQSGKLSLGEAADLAGMPKRSFSELLKKYNISLFNYPASDLALDVNNA